MRVFGYDLGSRFGYWIDLSESSLCPRVYDLDLRDEQRELFCRLRVNDFGHKFARIPRFFDSDPRLNNE
ncbi:hypothetical protein D3C75_1263440 [compost metagenome]